MTSVTSLHHICWLHIHQVCQTKWFHLAKRNNPTGSSVSLSFASKSLDWWFYRKVTWRHLYYKLVRYYRGNRCTQNKTMLKCTKNHANWLRHFEDVSLQTQWPRFFGPSCSCPNGVQCSWPSKMSPSQLYTASGIWSWVILSRRVAWRRQPKALLKSNAITTTNGLINDRLQPAGVR